MERTEACAGYRNTYYRNGGYDSAKNSAGSLHFLQINFLKPSKNKENCNI